MPINGLVMNFIHNANLSENNVCNILKWRQYIFGQIKLGVFHLKMFFLNSTVTELVPLNSNSWI
jgi:hypothetical protein